MKYVGFKRRVAAGLIDGIPWIPIIIIIDQLHGLSKTSYFAISLINTLSYSVYLIYFYTRWGQTIGKMVTHIKAVKIDGSPVDLKTAVLRSIVDLIWAIVICISTYLTLNQFSDQEFTGLYFSEQSLLVNESQPGLIVNLGYAYLVWVLADLLVIPFNKKRRALHDFIAGTVVIHVPKNK